MSDCTACALHLDCLTNKIASRGPDDARVLLVGQGPGGEEDVAGEAFVGKSGRLLMAMLRDAGYDPAVVRFTNATRCRSPQDRAPFHEEMDACRVHLIDEIRAVQPTTIIALGDAALRTLCGLSGVQGKRGQSFPLNKVYEHQAAVWPTYHPAYVLRVPNARDVVVADLRRARDDDTPQVKQPWTFPPARLRTNLVAYDIETYNEEGGIDEEMTQIAASDGQTTVVSRDRAQARALLPGIAKARTLVSHFGWDFDDLKTGLRSHYDTAAMAYLDDETQPLALESLCVKYLGVRGWKEARDGARLGTPEMCEYNARDAINTHALFCHLAPILGERIRIIDHMIRPARLALDDCSARGVYIDGAAVEVERVKQEAEIERARAAVDEAVRASGFPEDAFDVQLKTRTKHVPFNPGSSAHVARVLDHLGYWLPATKTGKPKTNKETLATMDQEPFVQALEAWRAATKRMSTYILPYAKIAAEGDGRAHPTYTVIRTLTGRSSAREPNVQNLDRDLKAFFSAPPGRCLVSVDYSGIEFRLGAWIAQEATILANYRKDAQWDPHSWFAERLYPDRTIEKKGDERQLAKSANFSQEFLGNGETLRAYALREMGIVLTSRKAHETHVAWHASFPGWMQWYAATKEELLAKGYVESPTGRRRHYGDFTLLNVHAKAEALREACNAKVQGFTFDFAALALGACHKAALPMVAFIHDDIKFEFDSEEEARAHENDIRRCMVDEPLRILREKFGLVVDVPIEVEFTYKTTGLTVKEPPMTKNAPAAVHTVEPLVVSMTGFQNFKRCRKLYDFTNIRNLSPAGTESEAAALGTEFHQILAAVANVTRGLPPGEYDKTSPMFEIARAYLKHKPLPPPENIVSVEEPFYTLVLDEETAPDGTTMPAVYLRTTLDRLDKTDDGRRLCGIDYKTFDKAPSLFVDLDFQGRTYDVCLWKRYGDEYDGYDFRWEHVRRELGRTLKATKGAKKGEEQWVEWSADERYIPVTITISDIERATTWKEIQDTAYDLRRAIAENRLYRQDLKTGPHSCNSCFVRNLCVAEYQHGELDDQDIALLTKPTELTDRQTASSIASDPRVLFHANETNLIAAAVKVYGAKATEILATK